MLILFKHFQHLLTKSSVKVTASLIPKMSSSPRTLRSRTQVKTEHESPNDKAPQIQTSKYFQNKQIKEEPGVPAIEKGTKKALKIKQEDKKKIKQESTVPITARKTQLPRTVIKTEPNVSKAIKTEVLSEEDFISPKLELQKGAADKVSPQKRKQAQKTEKVTKLKTEHVQDVEDMGWEPENWRVVLDNILKMRKLHVAPVDSLGCEECPEEGVSPEVFRYQTLISVMLSSQTRDEVTYAATQRLIAHGLTVDSILATSDEKIGELIYPAGFWKSKVKYIRNTTQILKDQYNGDIPRTFKDLCKLPGVGPKMANIVMSVGWNDTVGIAVDTHVHRISNRLGWVPKPTKDPEHTRKALEAWLPRDQWRPINLTLVGFGQTICKPVGPSCENCLNSDLCPFGRSSLKEKKKKAPKK